MSKITLDDKIEYRGFWYLPSDPENSVAGTVTYYPNERIVLELIGSFGDSLMDVFKDNKEETILYGKTSDAKDITLLKCRQSFSLNCSARFPILRFTCDYMIVGKHILGLDEKCRYWAMIRIPELTYWCHPEAIGLSYLNDDEKISSIALSFNTIYRDEENIIDEVQIDENTSIDLLRGVSFNESEQRLSPKIEQYTYIEVRKKNATSIKDLLSDIFMFEQFLSFATLKIVKCSSITLYDQEQYQEGKGQKYYKAIEVIHPFFDRQDLKSQPTKAYDFLFNHATIKEIYPEILKKWYNEPMELAPIRGHLISSLEKKRVYSSVDFLIVVQAIEGFYRRFRSAKYRKEHNIEGKASSKLHPMLTELLNEFSDIDLLKRNTIDIDAVVDSRIYFSHFMPKTSNLKAIDGWELLEEARKLRILLLCCVLSLLGFNNNQINDLLNKSNSRLFV